jgi:hypothetical protein
MGEHDQEISEQQDNLFYTFAQTTLTRLKTLVEPLGGMPVQVRYYVSFYEVSSAHITIQTKNDYNRLLQYYLFQTFIEDEPRLKELFQQPEHIPLALSEIVSNVLQLDPIRDVIERYGTLDPTREQLLESYHRYRDVWTAPLRRYETVIPLLNFSSDVQQEVTIGTHLALSPFTPE